MRPRRKGWRSNDEVITVVLLCTFAHGFGDRREGLGGLVEQRVKLSQARSVDRRGVMSQHTELAGPMPRFCRSALRIKIHSLLAWPSPN